MGRSRSVILRPYPFLFTLSKFLSLLGTLIDVPSVNCAAVDFLNIPANVSNSFEYPITGDRKSDAGNGFFGASFISMNGFVASYFDDKDVSRHCCGKTPLCHLCALLPYW